MPVVSSKEALAIGKELGFSEDDVGLYKSQFDACDEDGGGSISSTELKTVMRACGVQMTDAEVERLVKEFDTDGTGDLDFGEFLHMMHKFQAGPSEVEVRRAMFEVRFRGERGVRWRRWRGLRTAIFSCFPPLRSYHKLTPARFPSTPRNSCSMKTWMDSCRCRSSWQCGSGARQSLGGRWCCHPKASCGKCLFKRMWGKTGTSMTRSFLQCAKPCTRARE